MFDVNEILKREGLAKALLDSKNPDEVKNVLRKYDIAISEGISNKEIQSILDGSYELSEKDLEEVNGGIALATSVLITWGIAYGAELFFLYQGAKAFSK